MVRFLLDQNFNHDIASGLTKRIPELDFVSTEQLGIKRFSDERLLSEAAELDRVVLTHDERTFHIFAYKKIELGEKMAGLVVVPDSLSIGKAIDELEVLIRCRFDHEWQGSILRLPI